MDKNYHFFCHGRSFYSRSFGFHIMIFLKRRRSSPTIEHIKQGMAADDAIYQQAKKHCEDAGIKMTKLRCLILHGCIKIEDDATAVEIWKILSAMIKCHAPGMGSIQRNLNMFSEHGILRRYMATDNVLRYGMNNFPRQ